MKPVITAGQMVRLYEYGIGQHLKCKGEHPEVDAGKPDAEVSDDACEAATTNGAAQIATKVAMPSFMLRMASAYAPSP